MLGPQPRSHILFHTTIPHLSEQASDKSARAGAQALQVAMWQVNLHVTKRLEWESQNREPKNRLGML